jgi:hypothetical protein
VFRCCSECSLNSQKNFSHRQHHFHFTREETVLIIPEKMFVFFIKLS